METELDLQKVGKFIAQLRNKKGLTQEQLADIIGTTFKTVSNWERGKNLPDITCQKKICDYFSITLYELLDGELNLVQRKKDKRKHINKIILIILLCLLLPLFIFFSTYYFTHKDSTHVYQITSLDKNDNDIDVVGSLIKTYSYGVINISNIKLLKYDIKSTDIVNVDLYSDDKLLYHTNNLDSFSIKYYKKDKINLNNIKLIINIKDINNKEYTFETYISFDDFNRTDNKIDSISFDSSNEVAENQIIKNLQKENFKNQNDDVWAKEIKDKNSNVTIMVYLEQRKIYYTEYSNEISKNIIYLNNSNEIEVYIFHNDKNVHTLVEKYNYKILTDDLDCLSGTCSTLDEVLKTMDKWIIRIFGE